MCYSLAAFVRLDESIARTRRVRREPRLRVKPSLLGGIVRPWLECVASDDKPRLLPCIGIPATRTDARALAPCVLDDVELLAVVWCAQGAPQAKPAPPIMAKTPASGPITGVAAYSKRERTEHRHGAAQCEPPYTRRHGYRRRLRGLRERRAPSISSFPRPLVSKDARTPVLTHSRDTVTYWLSATSRRP